MNTNLVDKLCLFQSDIMGFLLDVLPPDLAQERAGNMVDYIMRSDIVKPELRDFYLSLEDHHD